MKYSQNFNTEATWSCNMSYERKFCGLSEYVRFRKFRRLIKSTKWFKRDRMDFAYADLKSNFKFWGCLRPVWPLKSHISSFSFKYIVLEFPPLRLIIEQILINLILLQKHGFFFKKHKNSSSRQKFPFFRHITRLCILSMGWILLKSSERKISLGDPVLTRAVLLY